MFLNRRRTIRMMSRIAAPVALGVLLGALSGARLLQRISNRSVRLVFLPVLLAVGAEMILRGLGVPV